MPSRLFWLIAASWSKRIVRANYEGVVAVPSVGGFEIDYALATVAVISVEATVDRVTKAVWSSRSSVAAPARVNPIVVRTKTREEAEIIQEVVISKHATVFVGSDFPDLQHGYG